MALQHKNPAVKALMKSRTKAMQRQSPGLVLLLNKPHKKQQVYMQEMQGEMMDVDDVTRENDEPMDTSESQNAMLVDRNHHETIQTEIQKNEIFCNLIEKIMKQNKVSR